MNNWCWNGNYGMGMGLLFVAAMTVAWRGTPICIIVLIDDVVLVDDDDDDGNYHRGI